MNTPLRYVLGAALIAAILAGCGGGTGGTGATNSSTVSVGVMQKGSVILNGVKFSDTTATITIDDTPKTSAALQTGMVVKVLGSVNADNINGTAQRVKALIEVRGVPASINTVAKSFVLLNQTVFVDDQTVFSNLVDFTAINTTDPVEVHGLRDASSPPKIRATRIEGSTSQMSDPTLDEIRGVVIALAGVNPTTFNIGAQLIDATGAQTVPANASYQNGSIVEVYCNRPCVTGGTFHATKVKVEDAQDAVFKPNNGQRFEVEGLISGFGGHPGTFFVAGTSVTTTTSTSFEGGIATDLGDNVKVEAEGSWNGTTLTASKIEFKRSVIRLQGNVTAVGVGTFTLNVAGRSVTIQTDSFTADPVPPVGPDCVQVRGQRKVPFATPAVVIAGEIKQSCSSSGRPVMQAPVEAESPETAITLLGFPLDVSAPPAFEDINDLPITPTQFFDAVTPAGTNSAGVTVAGTLVKVTFDDVTNAVRQVELED